MRKSNSLALPNLGPAQMLSYSANIHAMIVLFCCSLVPEIFASSV
jgi:hypothetical protein